MKNNSSLLTKEYYDIKDTKDKIDKIENNYKNHLDSRKNIYKKEEDNGKNKIKGLFIDKIYFSQTVQKVVDFNNIMRKALQKAVFRKRTNLKKLELKEEVNYRIDIKPDKNKKSYVVKYQLKSNSNEDPNIISSKNFNFKNNGFYIDILRKRIKKIDEKIKKPMILSKIKNIDFIYKNEDNKKIKKDKNIYDNNFLNQPLLIPRDKYCYITKDTKSYKGKNILHEGKIYLKSPKNLIIDSKERFNYEGKKIDESFETKTGKDINEKKMQNLYMDNKQEIIYNGKENTEHKEKILAIQKNTNINFLKNRNLNPDLIPKKNFSEIKNFSINYIGIPSKNKNNFKLYKEKINTFSFDGKEKPSEMPTIEKKKEFIEQALPYINYIGKKSESRKENELKIQKELDLKYNGNKKDFYVMLGIKQNNIINHPKNIKDINNILKMEKKENFLFEGNDKDKRSIERNNLISQKIDDINYQVSDENMRKQERDNFGRKDNLIKEKKINFNIIKTVEKADKKDFNKKPIIISSNNAFTYKGKTPKYSKDKKDEISDEDKENKIIGKLYLSYKLSRNICYLTKKNIKRVPMEIESENKKEDIIFKRKDMSLVGNNNNGLLITKSRYIKNLIKEKIYKKPLFNEFYSYFIEQHLTEDESPKLKGKPKKITLNKKDSKDEIIPKEETKNFNTEKSASSNKPSSDKILPEKDDEDSGLIKRIIPGKGSSETFRIKPNHLLKVVKVGKDKTSYEQYIHVGKIVPKKIKEKDEEFIYIRYKSKTPSKSQKKNLRNNFLKDYNDDEDVKKYLPKWKEDGKNLKAKPKIEENEEDIKSDNDDKQINRRVKLIKVYKFNIKNYCYASKIRKKNDENDSKKNIIKKKYQSFNKDEKENENEYVKKEEFKQNIINNNCYYDKEIIEKNTYDDYMNHFKNLNKNEIMKTPISYKINGIIPNYLSKTRFKLIKDKKVKKEEEGKKDFKLKEKPINKLSLITKKRIKNLVLPILDRAKINIGKCIITKVNQKSCIALPNPIYKNEHYIITKKRKKIISKEIEELRLPSEKNSNCYITREREKLIIENKKIPLKNLHYIEKQRKKEMLNKIKTIQNIFRAKKNKDNKDENLLFNNNDKNAFIPRIKHYYSNKDESDKNNYIFDGYISKINKKHIFKLYPSEQCYISKQIKLIIPKQRNYSFLSLLDFFVKKNIQEYVFPKLFIDKDNKEKNRLDTNYNLDTNKNIVEEEDDSDTFTYPKYYKNLRRIFNFYKTKKREDLPEAQKLYDEMIPDIENSKSLNDLITKLNDNPENSNKLIDNPINEEPGKNIDNKDLIDEIGEFVKFDKNLSNSGFIKNKLKENPEFKNNKNLFNIIKNVDDEYNNLINGKYCFKCGKEMLKCHCDDINYIFKETENPEEKEEEEDDDLDFDLDNDEGLNTKKINYFEYDTNKKKGLQMINKPRLEDYVSQPKKVLQIYNQKQLNEINKNIRGSKGHLLNNSLNLFDNNYSLNRTSNSNYNYNQRYSSFSNNNINNTLNSNNDDNNKNFVSSYNFKK